MDKEKAYLDFEQEKAYIDFEEQGDNTPYKDIIYLDPKGQNFPGCVTKKERELKTIELFEELKGSPKLVKIVEQESYDLDLLCKEAQEYEPLQMILLNELDENHIIQVLVNIKRPIELKMFMYDKLDASASSYKKIISLFLIIL